MLCLRSSGDWVHAEVIHFDLGESDVKDCDLQERQNCTSKTTAQVNEVTVDEERSCGSAVVTLRVSPGFRKKIHLKIRGTFGVYAKQKTNKMTGRRTTAIRMAREFGVGES